MQVLLDEPFSLTVSETEQLADWAGERGADSSSWDLLHDAQDFEGQPGEVNALWAEAAPLLLAAVTADGAVVGGFLSVSCPGRPRRRPLPDRGAFLWALRGPGGEPRRCRLRPQDPSRSMVAVTAAGGFCFGKLPLADLALDLAAGTVASRLDAYCPPPRAPEQRVLLFGDAAPRPALRIVALRPRRAAPARAAAAAAAAVLAVVVVRRRSAQDARRRARLAAAARPAPRPAEAEAMGVSTPVAAQAAAEPPGRSGEAAAAGAAAAADGRRRGPPGGAHARLQVSVRSGSTDRARPTRIATTPQLVRAPLHTPRASVSGVASPEAPPAAPSPLQAPRGLEWAPQQQRAPRPQRPLRPPREGASRWGGVAEPAAQALANSGFGQRERRKAALPDEARRTPRRSLSAGARRQCSRGWAEPLRTPQLVMGEHRAIVDPTASAWADGLRGGSEERRARLALSPAVLRPASWAPALSPRRVPRSARLGYLPASPAPPRRPAPSGSGSGGGSPARAPQSHSADGHGSPAESPRPAPPAPSPRPTRQTAPDAGPRPAAAPGQGAAVVCPVTGRLFSYRPDHSDSMPGSAQLLQARKVAAAAALRICGVPPDLLSFATAPPPPTAGVGPAKTEALAEYNATAAAASASWRRNVEEWAAAQGGPELLSRVRDAWSACEARSVMALDRVDEPDAPPSPQQQQPQQPRCDAGPSPRRGPRE